MLKYIKIILLSSKHTEEKEILPMKVDILEHFKEICHSMGIQVLYLSSPYQPNDEFDYGLLKKLFPSFDYCSIFETIDKNCLPDTVYISKSEFYMYHTFFHFPKTIQEEYGYSICCIGPILFQPLTHLEFRILMEQHHIEERYNRDLQIFYSQLPCIDSIDTWVNIITTVCKTIFQKEIHLIQDHNPKNNLLSMNFKDIAPQPEPSLSTEVIKKRYAAENAMLQAIKRGDYTETVLRHNQFLQYRISPRNSDSVRNVKNFLFVANTLYRKAVEQVGVHPIYIDELSRQLAIQIESCTSEAQIKPLENEMIRKYCLLVKNHSRAGYSDIIHRCLDYIEFHYMEQISLKSLAEHLSVSSVYLSTLFKKEVGSNLSGYIQDIRLRQSLILLNSTTLPIQEVAAQCGFLDMNYFSRVFKKVYRLSPRDYRKQIQAEQ